MIIEQNILKTALLGTNNYHFEKDIFPDEIQSFIEHSRAKEAYYLDGLTLYLAYYKAGIMLDKIENISKEIPTAPKEKLPFCSEEMEDLLKMMLLEGSGSFISFFPNFIALVHKKKVILPSKYFSKIVTPDIDTINVFGERAKWIKSLEEDLNSTKIDYLSLKKAERNRIFHKLLKEDKSEAKFFLEEVYEAETLAGQLNYLEMIVDDMNETSKELISFIKKYTSENVSKTKTYNKIKIAILKAELILQEEETFSFYYKNIFSKIWKIEKNSISLKEREELKKLFEPLEIFEEDVDNFLYFIFSIVPIESWCELLSVEPITLIKKVDSMKTIYINEILLNLLEIKILRSKNKALINTYLKFKNFSIHDFTFLKYFTKDEIINFIESYIEPLLKHQVDIINIFEKEKRCYYAWSKELSLKLVKGLFKQKNRYYKKEWTKAIWTIAPYLHSDGMKWIERKLQDEKLDSDFDDLEENFGTIIKIKKLFNQVNM